MGNIAVGWDGVFAVRRGAKCHLVLTCWTWGVGVALQWCPEWACVAEGGVTVAACPDTSPPTQGVAAVTLGGPPCSGQPAPARAQGHRRVPRSASHRPPHLSQQASPDRGLGDQADSIETYLTQINHIPVLTAAQERAVAVRITAGRAAAHQLRGAPQATEQLGPQRRRDLSWVIQDGQRAKTDLVRANLWVVVSVASRYLASGMPLPDLIQEGNIALIRAVDKFDYTRGCPFSVYATPWIRGAMIQALYEQARPVRLPTSLIKLVNRWDRAHRELVDHLGRPPTTAQLATTIGVTPDSVVTLARYGQQPLSLEQVVEHHGAALVEELLRVGHPITGVEARAWAWWLRKQLQTVLASLSDTEASILRLRFGLDDGQPRTIDEISQAHHLTRGQVQHIQAHALARLRQHVHSATLRDYLTDDH